MTQIKAFLKRHLLTVGFGAVLIPLLVILGLQYRSLRALETALPAWRKEEMKTFLREVAKETETQYRREAEKALSVPSGAIAGQVKGVLYVDGAKESVLKKVTGVGEHFRQQRFPGAKSFYIAFLIRYEGELWTAVLFYDPATQRMKFNADTPEWFTIQLATAPYRHKIRYAKKVDAEILGIDQEENYHLLYKPITDEEQRVVGVAGMVLEPRYFTETLLPAATRRTIARHYPDQNPEEVLVTVRNAEQKLMMSNHAGPSLAADAHVNFEFIFRDWTLGARLSHLTEAQKARQTFILTISFSALMALLLLGGLVLALRTAARELRLSQMKSDFVSNVSHELRTPLSSIQVFGELLKHGRADEPAVAREFGAYIETESRRLTALINKILDFSRIESGGKVYQFAVADVRDVIAETFRAEAVRLRQDGFDLQLELPPTPLPLVCLDAEAIAQAFTNLLDNAAKYSGHARVIQVRVARQENFVTVAVRDYGIGIAPEEQEKIFEKFYRVGSALVHDVKGSGLGLSIVQHVVAAHRGQVTVQSALGQGSAFTLHLPVQAEAETRREAALVLRPRLEGE